MRRQQGYSHGKYQLTSLHSNDDYDNENDDLDDDDDNYNDDVDEDEANENSTTHRGCLQYQKVFSNKRLQSRQCITLNETTTIVNNNRDLTVGLGGVQPQTKATLQLINNSFDDEGETNDYISSQEQQRSATTEEEEGDERRAGRETDRGRYRQRFKIGLCTARSSWLGLKSPPGDAFSTQSRYSGRRRLDKLRSWTRSNIYSGVSFLQDFPTFIKCKMIICLSFNRHDLSTFQRRTGRDLLNRSATNRVQPKEAVISFSQQRNSKMDTPTVNRRPRPQINSSYNSITLMNNSSTSSPASSMPFVGSARVGGVPQHLQPNRNTWSSSASVDQNRDGNVNAASNNKNINYNRDDSKLSDLEILARREKIYCMSQLKSGSQVKMGTKMITTTTTTTMKSNNFCHSVNPLTRTMSTTSMGVVTEEFNVTPKMAKRQRKMGRDETALMESGKANKL